MMASSIGSIVCRLPFQQFGLEGDIVRIDLSDTEAVEDMPSVEELESLVGAFPSEAFPSVGN